MKSTMIIANPGINCQKEINISWHTDLENINSYLEYRKKGETTWCKVFPKVSKVSCFDNVYSIDLERNDIYERKVFLHCKVNLKKLEVDTKYEYQIDGESEIYEFKTSPKDEFSFIWISDFHTYILAPDRLNNASDMIEKIALKHPKADFVFCSGDSIAWGGSYSFWESFYQIPSIKKYMWSNTLGNHDYMSRGYKKCSSRYFKEVNNFPKNSFKGEMGVCYYFKYGTSLFIVIHNEHMGVSEAINEKVEAAINWIEKVIKNNPSEHIFLCQHYQWINGVDGKDRVFGYERWKSLCDKYHIELAIAANDHTYLRTYPVYQDKIDERGTVYMQCPSSDFERGQELKDLIAPNSKIAYRYAKGRATKGGIYVEVKKDFIKTTLYDNDMNIVDSCVIKQKK